MAEVREAHPDVEFHARTVKGEIEDGPTSGVGRLRSWWSSDIVMRIAPRSGLGTLTRHLIDHAPCPVMVTPHSDPHDHAAAAKTKEHDTATPS